MQCECFYRILNTKKEAKQLSFGSIFHFSLEDQDETNAVYLVVKCFVLLIVL